MIRFIRLIRVQKQSDFRQTNATTLFYRYVFYLCIMSESKQIRDQNAVHLLYFRVVGWGSNEMIESRIEPIHQNHVRAGIVEYEYLYSSVRNFSELDDIIELSLSVKSRPKNGTFGFSRHTSQRSKDQKSHFFSTLDRTIKIIYYF